MSSKLEQLDFNKIAKQVLNYLAENSWLGLEQQVLVAVMHSNADYNDHEQVLKIIYSLFSKRYLEKYYELSYKIKMALFRIGLYCFLIYMELMIIFYIVLNDTKMNFGMVLLLACGFIFLMVSSTVPSLVRMITTSYMKMALINP